MQKSELRRELQKEIQRHDLSTFVDEPPSVAQGGHCASQPRIKHFGLDAQAPKLNNLETR